MHIEIINGNIFESEAEAIILTVDGARAGMEGNIARSFQRNYPDVWEELEYDFEYPIGLGSAKIYPIHEDLQCKNKFCILASTLHHIDTLEDLEKLKILSSALRRSLILASGRSVSSVCSVVLSGGWRIKTVEAFKEMVKTYSRYRSASINAPALKLYILGACEFREIREYSLANLGAKNLNGNLVL